MQLFWGIDKSISNKNMYWQFLEINSYYVLENLSMSIYWQDNYDIIGGMTYEKVSKHGSGNSFGTICCERIRCGEWARRA
jgi:hypothetical protein